MLTAAVAALTAPLAEGAALTREALQRLYVEPVAVAARVDRPPALDGRLDDEAWRSAEPLAFGFSDPTTPGTPKNTTDVRVVCDGECLYVAFDCKELRELKATVEGAYNEKVPADDHVSILLLPRGHDFCDVKHKNVSLLIKVNPKGATWARRYAYLEGAARPGKAVKIPGLSAAAAVQPGRWAAEVKVPLGAFFADRRRMPVDWKVNFFRKRWARLYDCVKPGDPGHANWTTAWRPSAFLATFCPSLDMFGLLYVPVGKVVPDKIRALQARAAARPKPAPPARRDKPVAGFRLTPGDLEGLLGGPVAFVRHVKKGPAVRGDLSDPAWKKAEPFALRYLDLFVDGKVEKNRTYIRLLADDEYIYVGFDCEEDFMREIRAERDGVDPGGLWLDDCIDALFDPGRTETYRYFYICSNVKGAITKRRLKNDLAWQPKSLLIRTARLNDRWRAEMRVSFKDLGVQPGEMPKLWGGNFFRGRWARRPVMDETPGWPNWDYAWRPNPIGTAHVPEHWGFLWFEKADVVQPHVAKLMKAKGIDLARAGLKLMGPRAEKPAPLPAPAAKPAFARKPQVRQAGRETTVRFAAKAATDIAVWVADAKGKVVRHLAGGVLGKGAPAPLTAGPLEQRLAWDGRDDDGKPLPAGTYRVHVGLGLGAKFERIIGWRPGVGRIRSLAVAPGGKLLVFTGGASVDHGWGNAMIRACDRTGRYARQVYPFSSALPIEKMRGVRAISLPDGGWVPVIYNALNHSWLPESPAICTQQAAVTRRGEIILGNMCMRGMGHGRRLLKISPDGAAPADMLGPRITKYSVSGEMYVAMSPDDKHAYVAGLRGRSLWDPGEYHNCVYRVRWGAGELEGEFRKPFIGEFQKPGSDPYHLNNPRGLAVDRQGNIIVADAGNNRLAAYRPDGSPLAQIPLPGANKVAVHPKTDALYVLRSSRPDSPRSCRLVKLKSLTDPGEQAGLDVGWRTRGALAMALDAEADPPIIWLGSGDRVADQGGKLVLQGSLHEADPPPGSADQRAAFEGNLMYVDRRTERIYAGKWHVFDGKTGEYIKRIKLEPKGSVGWGGEIAVGPDGCFYFAANNSLIKLDASGRQVPFAEGVTEVPKLFRGHGNSNRGHCVAPNGDVYFIHHYHGHGNTQTCVSQVSPDGKVKRYEFIDDPYTSGSGIRVDRKGNVYVGLAIKPAEEPHPAFYRGRLPGHVTYPHPWFYYRQMYGSIVKFKPAGGRVVRDVEGGYHATNYSYFHRCRVEGAEWVHFGYSPMHQKDVESSRCNCESARFDLDGFDRLFIPDAMRCSVEIIDSNANRICRLGGYGNMDARGPASACPKPEIPLAWPLVVFATDSAMYVADTINQRIVKARLTYAAEEAADVKLP